MTSMKVLQVLLVVVLQSAAQLLLKAGSNNLVLGQGLGPLVKSLLSPPLIAGLVIYGSITFLWLWVVRDISLSRAYMFFALCFVLVPLGSAVFFNDPVSPPLVAGTALIILGLLIVVRYS